MITIKVTDKNNTTEFYARLYQGIDSGLQKSTSLLRKNIRDITPVKTGNLKKSMSVNRLSGKQSSVVTDVEYAPYVELGTVKMKPRAMMRTGFDSSVNDMFNTIVQEIISKYS